MGDFIRLMFNIPFTVSGNGPVVRFDPDIIVNVKGRELDIRHIKVRKSGGLIDTSGSDLFSIGENISVYSVLPNPSTTCYEPTLKAGEWNETEPVGLSLTEAIGAEMLVPGAAFDVEATGEYSTTPALTATLGRFRCEIVSTNPLVTRFRVNFSNQNLDTKLTLFTEDGPLTELQAGEYEVEGMPYLIRFYVRDNFPRFVCYFTGQTVTANGQVFPNRHWAMFSPSEPPPGLHHGPYKFCLTRQIAWVNIPFTFENPLQAPIPAPPLAPCVSVEHPTNIVRSSEGPEGAAVDYKVTARSACGTNVTLTCVPPAGSLFPQGVTFVVCQAVDELGYSARCRFPVTVGSDRRWVSLLHDAAEGSPVVLEVRHSTSAETEVEILVPGFWTETRTYGGREFSKVEFPNAVVRGEGFPEKPGDRGWFDFTERQNQVRRNPSGFTQSALIGLLRPAFPEGGVGELPKTAEEMEQLGIDPRGAQPGLAGLRFVLASSPLNTPDDLRVSTIELDRVRQVFEQPVMPAGFEGLDAGPGSRGFVPPELVDQTYYDGPGAEFGDLNPLLASPQSSGRLAQLPLSQPLFRLVSRSAGEFVARVRLNITHAKGTENFVRRLSWDAWMNMPRFVNGAGLAESLNQRGLEPLASRSAHYLILTPQAWRPALEEFAQWKRKKGLHVDFAIVRGSRGGEGDVDAARGDLDAYIEDYYNQHAEEGVFVLIAGDVDVVPSGRAAYYTIGGPDKGDADSDHVYEVIGFSVLPSLSVGRLSCNSQSELETQLRKILTYEQSPLGGDWPGHATLAANREEYPDKYTAAVVAIADYDGFVNPPVFDLLLAGAPMDSPIFGTTQKLIDAINEGRGWIMYRGHGGSDAWLSGWDGGTNEFEPSDLLLLSNNITPIIGSIACQTARIKYDDSLGERFMAHEQGAVAFYGATINTYTGENHVRAKAFFRSVYEFGQRQLGPALNLVDEITFQYMFGPVGSGGASWGNNAFSYLLLGDPEMSIRRKPVVPGFEIGVEIVGAQGGGLALNVSKNGGEPQPDFFVNILLKNGSKTNGFTGPEGTLLLAGLTPEEVVAIDVIGDGIVPAFLVLKQPTLTALGLQADGFSLMLHGVPGGHYDIEGSFDLKEWKSVGSGVAGINGALKVVDQNATNETHRFYRARVAP
jgi:hypothetical protein